MALLGCGAPQFKHFGIVADGLLVTFFVVFVDFRGVRTTASGRFVSSHIALEAGKDLVTGRIKGEEEVGGICFPTFSKFLLDVQYKCGLLS